ncbi:hypothetical protein JXJ21_00635 [candidate division KSB1 bacterium]|nr:hypothetical protein [candidate division KSB1 bacterium]
MSPDRLLEYLKNIEIKVKNLENAYIECYEEEILLNERANLRIRIRFSSGYLLEPNDAILNDDGQINHLSYRYHFQDKQNNIIFRYDNTPHFPGLKTFPHHKHLADNVVECQQPSIAGICDEVTTYLKL